MKKAEKERFEETWKQTLKLLPQTRKHQQRLKVRPSVLWMFSSRHPPFLDTEKPSTCTTAPACPFLLQASEPSRGPAGWRSGQRGASSPGGGLPGGHAHKSRRVGLRRSRPADTQQKHRAKRSGKELKQTEHKKQQISVISRIMHHDLNQSPPQKNVSRYKRKSDDDLMITASELSVNDIAAVIFFNNIFFFKYLRTNLCKYFDQLGLMRRPNLQELSPPLFSINQEEPVLLCRPRPLQWLLQDNHTRVTETQYLPASFGWYKYPIFKPLFWFIEEKHQNKPTKSKHFYIRTWQKKH